MYINNNHHRLIVGSFVQYYITFSQCDAICLHFSFFSPFAESFHETLYNFNKKVSPHNNNSIQQLTYASNLHASSMSHQLVSMASWVSKMLSTNSAWKVFSVAFCGAVKCLTRFISEREYWTTRSNDPSKICITMLMQWSMWVVSPKKCAHRPSVCWRNNLSLKWPFNATCQSKLFFYFFCEIFLRIPPKLKNCVFFIHKPSQWRHRQVFCFYLLGLFLATLDAVVLSNFCHSPLISFNYFGIWMRCGPLWTVASKWQFHLLARWELQSA